MFDRILGHRTAVRSIAYAGTAIITAAGLAVASPAAPSQAQALPAPYSGVAHGDLVSLPASLVDTSVANVPVGHSRSTSDSALASKNVTAVASNVDASLLSAPITVDRTTAVAPPDSNPAGKDLLPVNVPTLAQAAVVHGDVEAHYKDKYHCPTLGSGMRLMGKSVASTAGVNLVSIPTAGALAQVGAVQAVTDTELVPNAGGTNDMRSRVATTVGDIKLLGGQVVIHVSNAVVTTATSNGTTGTASRSNYVVTVTVGGTTVASIPSTSTGMTTIPVNIAGLTVNLAVGVGTFTDGSSGATGAGSQDAVVKVALKVSALTQTLANVNLAVGAGDANAVAPTGGVDCTVLDADGDGLTDTQEAALGTDPHNPDTDGDGLTDGQEVNTYKTNPLKRDTDGDGLADGAEVHGPSTKYTTCRTNPLKRDTDGEGLTDGQEVRGIFVKQKVYKGTGHITAYKLIGKVKPNPCKKDTDGDGLSDKAEVHGRFIKTKVFVAPKYGRSYVIGLRKSNPLKKDTDGDNLGDKAEVTGSKNTAFGKRASDPARGDTDFGGRQDGPEIAHHTDPTDYLNKR